MQISYSRPHQSSHHLLSLGPGPGPAAEGSSDSALGQGALRPGGGGTGTDQGTEVDPLMGGNRRSWQQMVIERIPQYHCASNHIFSTQRSVSKLSGLNFDDYDFLLMKLRNCITAY